MGILLGLHIHISFLECASPTNCPNGGTNYECNANVCVCPSPKVLDGDKCVAPGKCFDSFTKIYIF